MKIVLIGPVYPYKGGISHYTGLMYKALSERHDVEMISYSMQYPKFMFHKEQRDYSNDTFKIDDTEYLINTANPFSWINVNKKINRAKPDLVIVQWWHPYFAPSYQAITKRIKGPKVLFVCHNVFPHERFPLDRILTYMTLKAGDYFIVQSGRDEEDLKSIIPNAIYRRAVHPTYNAFKMTGISKKDARSILGLAEDERVMLFFGFVRKYKGLEYLIKAMPMIKARLDNCRLLIVGDFGDDKEVYIKSIQDYDIKDVVDVHDGYIPDKEVEKYFAACDTVILPYVSATQSGIVQIAYGFNKPVIATNVGGLPDVVSDGITGYLVNPEDPNALAEAVVRLLSDDLNKYESNVRKETDRFSWEKMVEKIEELFKSETL